MLKVCATMVFCMTRRSEEAYFDFIEVIRLSRINGLCRDTHIIFLVLLYVPLRLSPPRTLIKELFRELFGIFAIAEVQADILLYFKRRLHILRNKRTWRDQDQHFNHLRCPSAGRDDYNTFRKATKVGTSICAWTFFRYSKHHWLKLSFFSVAV